MKRFLVCLGLAAVLPWSRSQQDVSSPEAAAASEDSLYRGRDADSVRTTRSSRDVVNRLRSRIRQTVEAAPLTPGVAIDLGDRVPSTPVLEPQDSPIDM
jgi:hypothetical protein